MTGTAVTSSIETDGAPHVDIRVDEASRAILFPANDFENGDLIIELVCQIPPLAADAVRVCAGDGTALATAPTVGQHISVEGRYVLDLQHHSWAELHPVYRWSALP